jgi:hypothetical protein
MLPVSGCGKGKDEKPLPPLAPVKGKVTVDGQPLTGGQVALYTVNKEKGRDFPFPKGKIDSSGNYEIFTGDKPGAPLEKFRAVISPEMMPKDGGKGGLPGGFHQIFTDPAKSPLIFEVTASPQAGAYDLKLKK